MSHFKAKMQQIRLSVYLFVCLFVCTFVCLCLIWSLTLCYSLSSLLPFIMLINVLRKCE